MAELRGRGWTVLGYFVWMLGAGLALDGDGCVATPLLLWAGAGLIGLGMWQSWGQRVPIEGRVK